MLDLGIEYHLIPRQHLLEAASPIYDVNKFFRTNARHAASFVSNETNSLTSQSLALAYRKRRPAAFWRLFLYGH
jgi:hypothetical protein